MTRISSRSTFMSKKVFPVFWFGILGSVVVSGLSSKATNHAPFFLLMPVFMAVIGFLMMRKLVWDLADEVYDCGDYLLVRNRGMEERVSLSDIMNVSVMNFSNPQRVTLRLRTRGRFGDEIVFSPKRGGSFLPFEKNEIAEDLIFRVDRARRGD